MVTFAPNASVALSPCPSPEPSLQRLWTAGLRQISHSLAAIAVGVAVLLSLAVPSVALAKTADSRVSEECQTRREINGFAATVCITPDPDWKTKCLAPRKTVPRVEQTASLRIGEKVWALIFVTNPLPDATGNVNVTCDLRMVRPNGKISEHRDLPALRKKLEGTNRLTHLSEFVLTMKGEETDPVGEWVIEIVVHDKNRGVDVPIIGRYTLLPKDAQR